MLPNRFPDRGEAPEYNTVDATLWFFVAIRRYLDATGDEAFVRGELLPVLEDILAWHRRGTRYGIRVRRRRPALRRRAGRAAHLDGRARRRLGGDPAPRQAGRDPGALVQRAAHPGRARASGSGAPSRRAELEADAERARSRFVELFWNAAAGCLYDCVDQRAGAPRDRARRSRAAQPDPGPVAPVRAARPGARAPRCSR